MNEGGRTMTDAEKVKKLSEALSEMLAAFSMENVGLSASLRRTSAKSSARLALKETRGES